MHQRPHQTRPVGPTSRREQAAKRRRSRLLLGSAGFVVVAVAAVLIVMGLRDDPAGPEPPASGPGESQWFEGETHGDWIVRYTGYGQATSDGQRITLEPQAASEEDITHGGLIHTTGQCRDADFSMTVNTEAQTRIGEPNIWEVGWVLWNFQSDTHFYAVALKPNGWEISKQDPDYEGNQRFMASGNNPTFPIGNDYRVTVTQDDDGMTVSVDGEELTTVVDTDTPYREGAIGLYTEDARVHFSDFDLPDCARSH